MRGTGHFWTFRRRFAWQAQGLMHLAKSEENVRVLYQFQLQSPLHYTTLHYDTLRYTTITLHYTTLHYNYNCNFNYNYTTLITLEYTTPHYTTLHYTTTKMQMREKVGKSRNTMFFQ